MAHYTQDLVGHDALVCGNDVVVPVQLYEGDGTTALDLTGVQDILYIVKRRIGEAGDALISMAIEDSEAQVEVVGDPDEGKIEITFVAEDTLPDVGKRLVGYFEHELTVLDVAGNATTVFQGTLEVRATARAAAVSSS